MGIQTMIEEERRGEMQIVLVEQELDWHGDIASCLVDCHLCQFRIVIQHCCLALHHLQILLQYLFRWLDSNRYHLAHVVVCRRSVAVSGFGLRIDETLESKYLRRCATDDDYADGAMHSLMNCSAS